MTRTEGQWFTKRAIMDEKEWWLWTKFKRGTTTLSVEFVRSFSERTDYRRRISLRGQIRSFKTLEEMTKRIDAFVLPACAGSMAMFSTRDRDGDVLHSQSFVTPPIFHIDTVVVNNCFASAVTNRSDSVSVPIWLQPWLHHEGKHGVFFTPPYDLDAGYRTLDLSPIESLPPYVASAEIRDRIAVAVDAYLQAGHADDRFVMNPMEAST